MSVCDGLICQTGNAAEAGCQLDLLQVIHKTFGLIETGIYFKTEHTPEPGHLPAGDFMVGMGLQARIVDGFYFILILQEFRYFHRIFILALYAQLQSSHSPQG